MKILNVSRLLLGKESKPNIDRIGNEVLRLSFYTLPMRTSSRRYSRSGMRIRSLNNLTQQPHPVRESFPVTPFDAVIFIRSAALALTFNLAYPLAALATEGGMSHYIQGSVATLIDLAPTKPGWVVEPIYLHY